MLIDARRNARFALGFVAVLSTLGCDDHEGAGGTKDASAEDAAGLDAAWHDVEVGADGSFAPDGDVSADASELSDADLADADLADAEVQDAGPPGPTFDEVYAILSERCAFCHVPGSIGYTLGRLNLSTRELAYKNLVGYEGKGVLAAGIHCGPPESAPGDRRVLPYKPEDSLILSKLSRTPRCGVPMPDNLPALPDSQIALIEAWIRAGAQGGDASHADAGVEYVPWLSDTGLFADIERGELRDGVMRFEPRYKLWSDGAEKLRFVALPARTIIDTSDMDRWVYPVGTKVWKEFVVAGKRVETRLLEKKAADVWGMVSYQWREDGRDAFAVPEGVLNANGTQHDIPDADACRRCHGSMPDTLLGFSALQLTHNLGGLTMDSLVQAGRLSHPPAKPCVLPGNAVEQQALGYLHANCGHCHNRWSSVYSQLKANPPFTGGPLLWAESTKLGSVAATNAYVTTVSQPNAAMPELSIIEPGLPEQSEMFLRMGQRGDSSMQMPPIATEVVDETGLAAVRAFIQALSAKP